MRRWLLILPCLFLLGCRGASPRQHEAVMQQAHQAFARGNYEVTLHLCNHVLADDPGHSGARTLSTEASRMLLERDQRLDQQHPGFGY